MQKIVNGELLALGSIPLAAALMARGVAFQESMPWQAGAAPVALVSLALSVKYVKEAITWEDEPVAAKEKVGVRMKRRKERASGEVRTSSAT